MSLVEEIRTQMRRANENEEADRNAEPPHTVSNQNGEEAEEGIQGGGEGTGQPEQGEDGD
jgi:hypothetical protein